MSFGSMLRTPGRGGGRGEAEPWWIKVAVGELGAWRRYGRAEKMMAVVALSLKCGVLFRAYLTVSR